MTLDTLRSSKIHTINRDANEKYKVIFTGDPITPIIIFDLEGNPRNVSYGMLDEDLNFSADVNVKAYANVFDPKTNIAAVTVADYSVVVNKIKTVLMGEAPDPPHLPIALITIPRGVADQVYTVYVNGTSVASFTAGDSNQPATWRTTYIATQLYTALSTNLTTGWEISVDGSNVFIVNTAGDDFTLKVEDSWGNQAMVGIKETVRRFEDLPLTLPSGLDHDFDVVTLVGSWEGVYYSIKVDGVQKALAVAYRGTTIQQLALALYNQLVVNLLPDPVYRCSYDGAAVTIWRTDATHAAITTHVWGGEDANGMTGPETLMSAVAHDVIDFTNVTFAVKPDPTTQNGTYYVKWKTLDDNGRTTSGAWVECAQQGIPIAFDASTMPHRLVRMPDGSFVFAPILWKDREVGDIISAPAPTFVGKTIEDVVFFKNRLGFLSGGNFVLSRTGEFFDFWPTTATDVLDDDPLDAECSSKQVAILRHGVPFQSQMVLFSDQQQFSLSSGSAPFTPKAATGDLTTSVAVDRCEPVAVGSNIYFASPAGKFTSIREMFVATDTLITDSADVTAHCPVYIPANITKIAACGGKDTIFVHSSDAPSSIYVYKFYWNGDTKAQSAWFKWTFGAEVICMDVIDNFLYLLLAEAAGPVLEKINLETKEVTEGLAYRILLDRQKVLAGSFDTDHTNFTAPYAVLSTDKAFNYTTKECVFVTPTGSFTFSVPGNWAGATVIFGRPYTLDFRFSEFGMKSADPKVYSRAGRGQLRTINLSFEDTMSFDVAVSTVGRADSTQRFRASVPVTGEKRFTTLGDTRTTRVSIRSDSHLPCKFGGASYETLYAQRSK